MRVLAIDQGTSATKAMVVDGDGAVLSVVERPVAVRAGHDGSVELDPEDLWTSVVEAGRAALAAAGGSVDAIGLANQGETVLAWDRSSGAPRSAGIVWQDGRAASVCDRLREYGSELTAVSGLELDPYFAAPKVTWLREQLGDDGPVITTTDTWLLHRLCGAFVTDAATASRWLTLDLDRIEWHAGACDRFGIDPTALPAIVPNAAVLGSTTVFGGDILITGTCVDQQAALFAESCLAPGATKCTYGTGAFLLVQTGDRPIRSTNGLVGCVAWKLPTPDGTDTSWCLDGQVFTVGAAVSWLQQIGLIDEPADLDHLGGPVESTGGTVFVPGLAGLGAPFWQPDARGAFTGLGLATGRGELVRAVIEGIAASVAFLVRAAAADLGAPLEVLRVDGGLTRSHTLLQLQADLLQLPVEVYPSPHATALGVAGFARLGVGAVSSVTDAIGGWRPVVTVEPSWSADHAEATLDRWLRAAEATAGLR